MEIIKNTMISFWRLGSKEAASRFAELLMREGWFDVRVLQDTQNESSSPDWIVEGRKPNPREKQIYEQQALKKKR